MRVRLLAALALGLAVVLVYRLFIAPTGGYAQALAYTECPFRGEPRVTVSSNVVPPDTLPVRMHEQTHADQCRTLGPWRYRWKNLTGSGRLSLESPAYCAGARARLAQGDDPSLVRERVIDDAEAAFKDIAQPASVRAALRASCPEVFQ